jgi:protein-tyrosine phosphatase
MPEVLAWRQAADPRAVVLRAAQALAEGQIVAFPTDTVYTLAASALIPEAVERLWQGGDEEPPALAVRGAGDALDWVPDMSPLGRRLARRCWPGPVALVFGDGVGQGLLSRLPGPVRDHLSPAGVLRLYAPGHPALRHVQPLLPGPLVLAEPRATLTAAEVGDAAALVIDDGPSPSPQPATVVRVDGNSWSVLQEGAFPAAELGQQTSCLVLFVCTGNTCRSPLAEALCKKKLADRLGCPVEELPRRGFLVISAGVAAMMGGGAAEEAVETGRAYGADLSGHLGRPLTPELAAQADYLVAMTRSHLLALAHGFPQLGVRPRLLSPAGEDVADPIGGGQEVYRACAEQIWNHLDALVAEIVG